ncbi:MAG: mechanosensitive ion channel family protein [Candidatus Thermoplasmatota archaeon]|nr:mechanosensitive ion channel family protein [Candidatus Thermoplasmatota archaeon]
MVSYEDVIDALESEIPVIGISFSRILTFFMILILGFIVIKIVMAVFKGSLKKSKMPRLMIDLLGKMVSAILYIVVILLALGSLGIAVGGVFIGLSAAIGLIIAFGLQDSLNNMFAGIWIATLRPIRMDEVVEVSGFTGKVTGLSMMTTELMTPDNKYITIPNKQVWGSPITNYTRMPIRRVDVNVGVAYGTDLDLAINVAKRIMNSTGLVLKDPPMDVIITELGDSAINVQLRPWAKTDDYWTLWAKLNKDIPSGFVKAGIEIPFPQMDLHLKKGSLP